MNDRATQNADGSAAEKAGTADRAATQSNPDAPLSKTSITKPTAVKKLGTREAKKLDKERRIKEAAMTLFKQKGYENATIREITKLADVGIGTIFRYATNKRDLLFFIYNDLRADFPVMTLELVPADIPLAKQLELFFGQLIGFFASQPDLARDILREAALYDSGLQVERYWQIRNAAEQELFLILTRAQEQGRFSTDVDVRCLTTLLFDIYRSALRRWELTDGCNVDVGLDMVRPLFRLALSGVGARDGEL